MATRRLCTPHICRDLELAALEKGSLCAKARMEEAHKGPFVRHKGRARSAQPDFQRQINHFPDGPEF